VSFLELGLTAETKAKPNCRRDTKKLAERIGERKRWDEYLAALRARYPTLRALHDELRKARL
jgi:hypothetical protein